MSKVHCGSGFIPGVFGPLYCCPEIFLCSAGVEGEKEKGVYMVKRKNN